VTDKIYDLLIEEDCKFGDHSNALITAYEMRLKGRLATTFHFNCLLVRIVSDFLGRSELGNRRFRFFLFVDPIHRQFEDHPMG